MKTFYSILQVPLRSAGHEQLNIGLLLAGDHGILFSYSEPKLHVLKGLIPAAAFNLLKSYLLSLKTKIQDDSTEIKNQFSSVEFLNYLSDYNNNLLTFSKPTPIEVDPSQTTFQKLFEKFVFDAKPDAEISMLAAPPSIHHEVQERLFPRIRDKVNIDWEVTSNDLRSLIAPVTVDFIGKNQVPVAGITVDFEKSEQKVTGSLAKFVSLIHALDRDDITGGKYYVVGREPKQNSVQHNRWENMRQTGFVEFIDVDDIQTVADYVIQHHVRPLFPENA